MLKQEIAVLSSIPTSLKQTLREVHGAQGEAWLRALPELLTWVSNRWEICLFPVKHTLSYQLVLPAIQASGEVCILKLGVPCRELQAEILALKYYQTPQMVQLLQSDSERGLLLLQAIEPGEPLTIQRPELELLQILTPIIGDLHQPQLNPIPSLPELADWALGFQRLRQAYQGLTGPFPPLLIAEAEKVFENLLQTTDTSVVLHGDLHPGNILRAKEGWIVIDPKGVVGDPVFEVITFLENYLPTQKQPKQVLKRCLAYFSEQLKFPAERVLAWGFAKTVLSAIWFWEDHGQGWENALELAGLFQAQLREIG